MSLRRTLFVSLLALTTFAPVHAQTYVQTKAGDVLPPRIDCSTHDQRGRLYVDFDDGTFYVCAGLLPGWRSIDFARPAQPTETAASFSWAEAVVNPLTRTYLVLANTATEEQQLAIEFIVEGRASPITRFVTMPAKSRRTLVLSDEPEFRDAWLAMAVTVTFGRLGVADLVMRPADSDHWRIATIPNVRIERPPAP